MESSNVGTEWSREAYDLLDAYYGIEARRVKELHGLIADKIGQDPTDISVATITGEIAGVLSAAEKAARYALRLKMISKGWEDPGWGL